VECGINTANAIPGAKLVIVKGMGHALPKALWPMVINAIVRHAKNILLPTVTEVSFLKNALPTKKMVHRNPG